MDPRRIVVVDDHGPMLRTYARILRSGGWSPIVMADALEALSEVLKHPTPVVLTDLVMPRMSGLELAATLGVLLRRTTPSVIVVSAHVAELRHAEMHWFAAMHGKPFVVDGLLRDVDRCAREALARWGRTDDIRALPVPGNGERG